MYEPKEKRQRTEAKCPRCNKRIRDICQSRQKLICTEEDATNISRAVQVKVNIGDVMCKMCFKAICTAEYRSLLMVKTPQQGTSEESFQSCSESEHVPTTISIINGIESHLQAAERKKEPEYTTMPFLQTASTHACCCLCFAKTQLTTIPEQARLQAFNLKRVYIPQGNRCCQDHLIKNRFYESELEKIKPVTNECQIPKGELTKFIESLSSAANITTIHRTIGNLSMPSLSWDNFNKLYQKTSMRNSERRN
ncbi:hypothetical protein FQA39_LY09915 [Lamprigera yunnana]|nr:hypothetical protein FQA39_LY09915 [Lamprigera yunnana]